MKQEKSSFHITQEKENRFQLLNIKTLHEKRKTSDCQSKKSAVDFRKAFNMQFLDKLNLESVLAHFTLILDVSCSLHSEEDFNPILRDYFEAIQSKEFFSLGNVFQEKSQISQEFMKSLKYEILSILLIFYSVTVEVSRKKGLMIRLLEYVVNNYFVFLLLLKRMFRETKSLVYLQ